MRFFPVFVLVTLPASFLLAQDAGQMAAEQAAEAAQQASQQAMQMAQDAIQASQQAARQAMLDNQEAMQNAANAQAVLQVPARKPEFSLKSGTYASPQTVRLKDSTRGAVMYYTVGGWTPTKHSTRYTGPIHLSSTATLQAIAIAPGCVESLVASAVYTITGAAPPVATPITSLDPGTPLPVVFTAPVSTKGLQIGDPLPVALAQDINVAGALVAPHSTPVLTTVLQVDGPGIAGSPGEITFTVRSLTLKDGTVIPLVGSETKQGEQRIEKVQTLFLIPFVGLGGVLIHGGDADIPAGATFYAFVGAIARI